MPWSSMILSSSWGPDSTERVYVSPEQPPPFTPTRRPNALPLASFSAKNATFLAARSVMCIDSGVTVSGIAASLKPNFYFQYLYGS